MSMLRRLLVLALLGASAACASPTAPTPEDKAPDGKPGDKSGTSFSPALTPQPVPVLAAPRVSFA
jgi:hypothetical protein